MTSLKTVKECLDKKYIPDLSNIITSFLICQKCKVLYSGLNKCECLEYMCDCLPKTECNNCEKIVCKNCLDSCKCCLTRYQILCHYCCKVIHNEGICIYKNCQERLCKKCTSKFNNLCRGHLLLRLHNPDHDDFQGLEGMLDRRYS